MESRSETDEVETDVNSLWVGEWREECGDWTDVSFLNDILYSMTSNPKFVRLIMLHKDRSTWQYRQLFT